MRPMATCHQGRARRPGSLHTHCTRTSDLHGDSGRGHFCVALASSARITMSSSHVGICASGVHCNRSRPFDERIVQDQLPVTDAPPGPRVRATPRSWCSSRTPGLLASCFDDNLGCERRRLERQASPSVYSSTKRRHALPTFVNAHSHLPPGILAKSSRGATARRRRQREPTGTVRARRIDRAT
jgi:hypothetical protein